MTTLARCKCGSRACGLIQINPAEYMCPECVLKALAAKDAEIAALNDLLSSTRDENRRLAERLAAANEQIEQLTAWKESTMSVFNELDEAYEACGSPGGLGVSKTKVLQLSFEQLRQELRVMDLRAKSAEGLHSTSEQENQRLTAEVERMMRKQIAYQNMAYDRHGEIEKLGRRNTRLVAQLKQIRDILAVGSHQSDGEALLRIRMVMNIQNKEAEHEA